MKTIAMGVCNGLMAASIRDLMQRVTNLTVCLIQGRDVVSECMAVSADIVLLEVAFPAGFTVEERIKQASLLRQQMPACRIVFLCDENSTPELARKVAVAKKDGLIDDFLFSSVGERYLVAILLSI